MLTRSSHYLALLCLGLMFTGSACGDDSVTAETDSTLAPGDVSVGMDVEADSAPEGCVGADDGTSCDDADPCTLDDVCTGGVCVGGSNDPCSSDNPCEVGVCVAGEGCSYEALEDGTVCDASCFESATCQSGACEVDADSALGCPEPDPLTQPCVSELVCEPATGECTKEIYAPSESVCDTDNNRCTVETCDAEGQCINSGELVVCSDQAAEDPCQTWACDKKDGVCDPIGFAGEVSCNDGNGCTLNDTCFQDEFSFIACKGTPVAVDDGNACTDDSCVDGEILHKPVDGLPCETGDECTPAGLCQDATCEFDGCPCYEDADCEAPENKCLGQMYCDTSGDEPSCQLKEGTGVVCAPPASPCFVSACVPDTGDCGVEPAELGTGCDDNDACTTQDVCDGTGECKGGADLSCDNGIFCDGPEGCDPAKGCVAGNAPALTDGVACTIDTCNEGTDSIDHVADPSLCDDGDACDGTELCDVAAGCQEGEPLECDDGNYCNGPEGCEAAVGCTAGTPPVQADDFECTVEVCDEETDSITSVPNDVLCVPPDGLCILGICDPAAGGCSMVTKLNCCGNGLLEGGEACDDGNAEAGDGCFECAVEEDWTCEGSPSLCQTCGDGVQQGNEVCDAGANNGCQSCKKDCSGPVNIYPGNMVIKTQADLDAVAGYSVVDGNLSIEFYKDGEIDLSSLECVKGFMQVQYSDVTHLDGLSNISYVGTTLTLRSNPNLTNVDGLSGIEQVDSLTIQDNDALLELDGLIGLEMVDKKLMIYANKTLESVGGLKNVSTSLTGELNVGYNDALLTLTGLQGVSQADKLTVVGNKMLANLSGLGLTKVASTIRISSNESLNSLKGLEGLTKLQWDLYLENNAQLLNVDALSQLAGTTGGRIRIVNCPKLDNLNGLGGVTKINVELYLAELTELASLSGLSNLVEIVGDLTIQKCHALPDLSGLEALVSTEDFRVQYNNGLVDIGLPNYGNEIAGGLYIVANSNLESLASFDQVEDIKGALVVGKNDSLPSLAGLNKVQEIDGLLHVYGNGSIENLMGLAGLEKVTSQATISDNNELKSCMGLGKLKSIGGGLVLQKNASLKNLLGLHGLTSVGGGLTIDDNDDLQNIDALSSLVSLGDTMYIDSNAELKNLDGLSGLSNNNGKSIFVRYNDELVHIDGLANFKGTVNVVELSHNKDLNDIKGLAGIIAMSTGLIVKGSDALENLAGLDNLQSLGYLTVEDNQVLTALTGLSGLKNVGNLYIRKNTLLKNVNALASLAGSIELLTLMENTSLDDLSGFAGVTSASSIRVTDCPNLVDLHGLHNLEMVTGSGGIGLRLMDNLNLTNLDALANVTTDEIKGEIRIHNNLSLLNLDGLSGFSGQVVGTLWVGENTALTSISGLDNLTKASSIKVKGNTVLDQCHIQDVLGDVETNSYCMQLNAASVCGDDC